LPIGGEIKHLLSCTDNIFILNQLVEQKGENMETIIDSIGLEKVYERINMTKLWKI
jgi:hypothetical protein